MHNTHNNIKLSNLSIYNLGNLIIEFLVNERFNTTEFKQNNRISRVSFNQETKNKNKHFWEN